MAVVQAQAVSKAPILEVGWPWARELGFCARGAVGTPHLLHLPRSEGPAACVGGAVSSPPPFVLLQFLTAVCSSFRPIRAIFERGVRWGHRTYYICQFSNSPILDIDFIRKQSRILQFLTLIYRLLSFVLLALHWPRASARALGRGQVGSRTPLGLWHWLLPPPVCCYSIVGIIRLSPAPPSQSCRSSCHPWCILLRSK